ncbi:hypothetical protein MATL_G00010640 [Megalops atlanticus]|uniref:Uncharacterized protein n=1 Tax=Megalops atlanticus TaxID=7932 RepID=A0A9D3QH28_MEGAT|nr:hypothetical protein MATL_G00010640 [Megalops atlanticus]
MTQLQNADVSSTEQWDGMGACTDVVVEGPHKHIEQVGITPGQVATESVLCVLLQSWVGCLFFCDLKMCKNNYGLPCHSDAREGPFSFSTVGDVILCLPLGAKTPGPILLSAGS